jgi:type I restriction enzyme R subunit
VKDAQLVDLIHHFNKLRITNDDFELPKTEALQFARYLRQFSFISQVARNRYRDEKLSLRDARKKVCNIVDEFLMSQGVDHKIPPVPISPKRSS